MSVNPPSDENTEPESQITHNPAPVGVEDLRDLLMCLQALHTESPMSTSRLDTAMNAVQIHELSKYCSQAGFFLKNKISDSMRLYIFELGYIVEPKYPNQFTDEQVRAKCHEFITNIHQIYQAKNVNVSFEVRNLLMDITKNIQQYLDPKPGYPVNAPAQRVQNTAILPANDRDHRFGEGWVAWNENSGAQTLIYTKDDVTFHRDSISNWSYYPIQGLTYLKKTNSPDCYVHVRGRQFRQGDTVIDHLKNRKLVLATQTI